MSAKTRTGKVGRKPIGKKPMTAAERKKRSRESGLITAELIDREIVEAFKFAFLWHCNNRHDPPGTVLDIYDKIRTKYPDPASQKRIDNYLMPMVDPFDESADDPTAFHFPAGNVLGRMKRPVQD